MNNNNLLAYKKYNLKNEYTIRQRKTKRRGRKTKA